jgi:D-beta-D-heptose 7-phosphate kinase/D-beta-D-heptose 1-phosphate adenosyltransferase
MAQPGRPTTTKTRVIAMHQQIVRVDDEDTGPLSERGSAVLLQAVSERLAGVDALVISDYAKGLLTPELLAAVIIAAQKVRTRVLVDPKGADAARYSGAYMIKPNRLELGLLTGAPVLDHAATDIAGQRLAEVLPGTLVLVTEGADGMSLFGCGDTIRVRPAARQVFDVTGAGDTVLATMAMAIASGAAPESAMELASEAAAIAISTLGTTAVTLQELRQAVDRG